MRKNHEASSITGAITLAQVAAKTSMLHISCDKCGRYGRQNVQKLIDQHGAETGLPELMNNLAKDCPRRQANRYEDLCGARYPQLPKMFNP